MSAAFNVYPTFETNDFGHSGWNEPMVLATNYAAAHRPSAPPVAVFATPTMAARTRRRIRSEGVVGFVIGTGCLSVVLALGAALAATNG